MLFFFRHTLAFDDVFFCNLLWVEYFVWLCYCNLKSGIWKAGNSCKRSLISQLLSYNLFFKDFFEKSHFPFNICIHSHFGLVWVLWGKLICDKCLRLLWDTWSCSCRPQTICISRLQELVMIYVFCDILQLVESYSVLHTLETSFFPLIILCYTSEFYLPI